MNTDTNKPERQKKNNPGYQDPNAVFEDGEWRAVDFHSKQEKKIVFVPEMPLFIVNLVSKDHSTGSKLLWSDFTAEYKGITWNDFPNLAVTCLIVPF